MNTNNVFKNLPESFAGLVYMACGVTILLDAIKVINAAWMGCVGGILLLWHGFIIIDGPRRLRGFLERNHSNK